MSDAARPRQCEQCGAPLGEMSDHAWSLHHRHCSAEACSAACPHCEELPYGGCLG